MLLAGLFLLTRLINITYLPIFTDEAIYIRWSQIGALDPAWRFISLTDGKQPLFTWLTMAVLRVIYDPLLAGRLVSVFAGSVTTIGLWLLSWVLFRDKKLSWLTSFLYVISPFALVYDRMAIYDSLVATCFVVNLLLAVIFVKTRRLDVALLLGLGLGAGMINKTSGFLSLYLLPLTLILFPWQIKNIKKEFYKWLGGVAVAAGLSQVVYSVLRLSPFFYIIAQKDRVFVYSLGEWLSHPIKFFQGNISGLFDWLVGYFGWPLFMVVIVSIFIPAKYKREKLLLLFYWLTPFVALALFGKVLYPRFIFFMVMPLILLAASPLMWLIDNWGKRFLGLAIIAIIIFPNIWTSYLLITNPLYAPIPLADKGQYMNDWPAGWGVREVVDILAFEAKNEPIAVYTEGTFGLLPYALEIYLHGEKNLTIKGIWPLPDVLPSEIAVSVAEKKTYLITNQSQTAPPWPLQLISEYQKGTRPDRALRLYRVVSEFAYKV